ncbi:MAG: hypothetical protein NZ480_05840 [Bdellovibrionaceae bacterium]|nr:hypothetical protein [Pseudobdellovibrionaceae bacterium]MDW8190388.1 hypothetical protein [Pseudobdellovibrionaceae bacterium]
MSEVKLVDAVRKLLTVGLSGAALSEDLIKNYLTDLKLPKDILQTIIQGAQKSKEEMASRISAELVKVLKEVDWSKELGHFLETHRVQVKIDIDFQKKDPSPLESTALSRSRKSEISRS